MKYEEWDFYAELGRRIGDARRGLGLRQEDLARRLGVSRSSVANIEAGRQVVSSHMLFEMDQLLALDFEGLKTDTVPWDVAERQRLVEENKWLHHKLGRLRVIMNEKAPDFSEGGPGEAPADA